MTHLTITQQPFTEHLLHAGPGRSAWTCSRRAHVINGETEALSSPSTTPKLTQLDSSPGQTPEDALFP